MRIAGIEAIPIDIPLARNFGASTYAVLSFGLILDDTLIRRHSVA